MIEWKEIDTNTTIAKLGPLHVGTVQYLSEGPDDATPWKVSTLKVIDSGMRVIYTGNVNLYRTAQDKVTDAIDAALDVLGHARKDRATRRQAIDIASQVGTMGDIAEMLGVITQRISLLISRYPNEYPKPVGACKAGNLYWLPEWKGART